MEWKDIAGAISSAAPILGTAIGGPAGGLLGGAVSAVIKAFGLSNDATPEQVQKAITSDPDAALKLMVAENEFKLRQRDQDLAELKELLLDKQSARNRQIESEKVTGKRDSNLYAMAWLGILGYLALIVYLIAWGLPKMTAELALMVGNLIGIVGAKYSSIFDYFFGSSKSSAEKTKLMAKGNQEENK